MGARFLPLSYIGVVVGGGERVFDLSNRGEVALEESKHLFIYTLLYSRKKGFLLSAHFPPLNVSPLLVCSTGSVGSACIVRQVWLIFGGEVLAVAR